MTKFFHVKFWKSHGILDQFHTSIKSYIKIFETADLPPPTLSHSPGMVKGGYRETPVLESLLIKLQGFKPVTSFKRGSDKVLFL